MLFVPGACKSFPDGTARDGQPSFSPDGKNIAFFSFASGDAEVWKMKVDGTERANLTNNAAFDAQPSWQPLP